jgi:hypothetical protein
MARLYNGVDSQSTLASTVFLNQTPGPFTISFWFKPADLNQVGKTLLLSGHTANALAVRWEAVGDSLDFVATGFTGTDPNTGSAIALSSTHVTNGAWCAYRYQGAGAEWSRWLNRTKTVINSAITFTTGNNSGDTYVGSAGGSGYVAGAIAEIAIWSAALSDDEMNQLQQGMAADQFRPGNLLVYWPLRGNHSPEPDYVSGKVGGIVVKPGAKAFTVGSETKTDHPAIMARLVPERTHYEPAWLFDVYHGGGTVRSASMDLNEYVDEDVLGAFYAGRIRRPEQIHLVRRVSLEPATYGAAIDLAADFVVQLANPTESSAKPYNPASEWRNVACKLWRYDRTTHELVSRFVGVIKQALPAPGEISFAITSAQASVLDTLVPTIRVNGADFPDPTDIGAPIPIGFGNDAVLSPPFVSTDVGSNGVWNALNPGGDDFLAGLNGTRVKKVWLDINPDQPGLELAASWETRSDATYATASSFTEAGRHDNVYDVGRPVRAKSAGATVYSYSVITVVSYVAPTTTVTLADAILASPINTLEIASEFYVEDSRYTVTGADASNQGVTTVRLFTPGQAGQVLLQIAGTVQGNPANVIEDLLNDPVWSVGKTTNTTSFTAAKTAFSDVGMNTAVRGVLGGDRQFRRLADVLLEILAFRGARLSMNASNEWEITVDSAAAASVVTFGLNDGYWNNIVPGTYTGPVTTALSDAIDSLILQYSAMGRQHGAEARFKPQAYEDEIDMPVLSVGEQRFVQSPWLRPNPTGPSGAGDDSSPANASIHYEAKLWLYYRAQRMKRADDKHAFETGMEGRNVSLGDLIRLKVVDSGADGTSLTIVDADKRVIEIDETLTRYRFVVEGYNADIYSTNVSTIADPDVTSIVERPSIGSPHNLIPHPDFSMQLKRAGAPSGTDTVILPFWTVFNGSGVITALNTTEDKNAIGGWYMSVTTSGTTIGSGLPKLAAANSTTNRGVISIVEDQTYIWSIYASIHKGFRLIVEWFNETGGLVASSSAATRRQAPIQDINGLGWRRYYIIVRAPILSNLPGPPAGTRTAFAFPYIVLDLADGTYSFDAAQFEPVDPMTRRPSRWKPFTFTGFFTEMRQAGHDTILAPGEREHGTQHAHNTVTVTANSGTSTLTATAVLPAGAKLKHVTARIITASITITGGAGTWSLGVSGATDAFANGKSTALGTTVEDTDNNFDMLRAGASAVDFIVTADGGGIFNVGNTGQIKITAHYEKAIAPTA